MKKKLIFLFFILSSFYFFSVNGIAKENGIEYSSHVQSYGWMDFVKEGEISGTEGEAKRLESIKISLLNYENSGIEYISYVQTYGWEETWKSNGEVSGTEGEAKRLEAIKIRLTGEIEGNYDVYYRVHVQSYGWLGWAKNGETAGTTGLAKRLEAIEIKLIEKGEGDETKNSYVSNENYLTYYSHVQSYGWLDPVSSGLSGTEGKGKRLEAFVVSLVSPEYSGSIQYQSYIEGLGWEDWKNSNQISGTVGQSRKIERISMKLIGDISEYYDIYYRTHVQGYGWLGWAKNGETAGTENLGFRIEAIEIKLVEKGKGEETGNSIQVKDATVYYESFTKNENFGEVEEGQTSGITGKSIPLYAFKARLETQLMGSIKYQSYILNIGWEEDWKGNEKISSSIENSDPISQIKIMLDGELAEKYDVYYRVHISHYGWLDWAKNGESAGSDQYSIEAIEVKLFLKIDSQRYLLETENHYLDIKNYNPTYYSQKDSRWANIYYGKKKFGNTGCAPTSLAMAFTGILNRPILPTDVADYLYNHTNEFNKKTSGSSGLAIIYASRFYGIKYKALLSLSDIRKDLVKGKIIYGAMGNGKFGTKNWNHAIIFYQYDKGSTYVYDPLNFSNNGWISINQLWNEQSKDSDDSQGGSNFYSLDIF